MIQYEIERNKLPFWEKSKFPIEFELKIQEMNQFAIGLQFKGFNPLDKISIDSPKSFLGMIFNIVNLD
jgi:hypothetical protein